MRNPCAPSDPSDPCRGMDPFEDPVQTYTNAQLESLPQCNAAMPQPPAKSITVQQPPRLICTKRVVFTERIIPEPMVVNRCRQITIPKVIDTTRVIRVPKLTWHTQLVREPRVVYYPSMVPDPYVVCYPKRVCEPREVCQSILCQPKPQQIDIPPPLEYCCYPNGPISFKPSATCPPCVVGPGGTCGNLPCFGGGLYPLCEPCRPSGPSPGPMGGQARGGGFDPCGGLGSMPSCGLGPLTLPSGPYVPRPNGAYGG